MKTIDPTKTVNELINIITYITDIEEEKKIYHSWRVAVLSAKIADDKDNLKKLRDIFYAGTLHDIGGVGFPYHIIHYLQRNDKTSRSILLSHPIIGAQLVSGMPQMADAAKLILDHHEWINGQGYPRAKSGNSIPLGSQLIRIADAIDILLQGGKRYTLKSLRDRMLPNVGKEYAKPLFESSFELLGENRFFCNVCRRSNVPEIFKDMQDEIGPIHVPQEIDAIGTTLEVISQIIDMKHPYSSGHSLRVSRYAIAIALALNLSHDEITRIKWAGLIHDIGKLNVSRRILSKRSILTSGEYKKVKEHAHFTGEITSMIPSLIEIVPIASSHHEHFDGSGYPLGLKNGQIPLGARILGICDAFDAMTSNRPYRNPLTPDDACREIIRFSGKQFDPDIVKLAIPIFKNLGL
jgi:HD-GYP domain-containing protein (c-di-GMP phosphodiesterase class II)